jgi:integrase
LRGLERDGWLVHEEHNLKAAEASILELQDFFNSFHPRLSPKSIRLMHACLRVHLNQAKVWGMVENNPAIGVKLPRRKQRKPTILLPLATISQLIELLPERTKTVVTLIVFGSLRIGEVLALRWRHIQADRITVKERVYEGEFDDVKTDAGERQVPFDKCGLMKNALVGRWYASKHRQADDLVFPTRKGGPLERRNLLRHIKAAATQLGLSRTADFRSLRTMHSSLMFLMLREGARPEVVRDNMGHANIDVTQNVYGKSWWEERVDAVTRAVEAVANAAKAAEKDASSISLGALATNGCPFGCPGRKEKSQVVEE